MPINSKKKGARGERQWRDVLRAWGFLRARRGQQYSGLGESPDVVCEELPDIHYEVKRCQVFQPYRWLEQASQDCGDEQYPTIAFRRNDEPWLIIRYAADDLEIIRRSDLPKSPNGN